MNIYYAGSVDVSGVSWFFEPEQRIQFMNKYNGFPLEASQVHPRIRDEAERDYKQWFQ